MSSMPASANTSASPSLAQHTPSRPARNLQARKLRRFVCLGVRPEPDALGARRRLHAIDVALEARFVDEYGRGAKVAQLHDGEV